MRSGTAGKLPQRALYLLAWTVAAIYFSSQEVMQRLATHDHTAPWRVLLSWLSTLYVCSLLTLGVLWMGRQFPIERRNWVRRTALHLLCSILFALIDLALASLVLPLFRTLPATVHGFVPTFAMLIVISFHGAVLTYWVVLGIQIGLRSYRIAQEREKQALRLELQAAELQGQLVQAELGALKMQLQPHFLFNTLNAITVLVRQQRTSQAEEMLARLSDLLRCVLEDVETQEVPLQRELEYLRLYLSIEEVRFQDRLRVEIESPAGLHEAAVPHMILQPVVENAIRHGLGRSSTAGRLQIRAEMAGELLRLTVKDDGPGVTDRALAGSGIGLSNTRARLQQLYGDAGSLCLANAPEGGALVTIELPYRALAAPWRCETGEKHALHGIGRG